MADLPPLPRPNSRGLDALPGSQGMPQALPRVLDVIAALIGAPTEGEGSQMDAASRGFQSSLAAGDREGMARALGEGAGVLAPFMAGAGTFAGVGAKTADLVRLASAEAMEQAGKSADDIWRATGWGRGADGKWRFEIDDSEALIESAGHNAPKSSRHLMHEDLQDAYPSQWAETQQSIVAGKPGQPATGEYNPVEKTLVARGAPETLRSTALHEAQHMAQGAEGFARGSNLTASRDYLDEAVGEMNLELRRLSRLMDEVGRETPTGKKLMGQYEGVINEREALVQGGAFDHYKRHAGEVEARNVQTRMNMNAQERLQTPPWATEDVPRDQQIVRRR